MRRTRNRSRHALAEFTVCNAATAQSANRDEVQFSSMTTIPVSLRVRSRRNPSVHRRPALAAPVISRGACARVMGQA